VTFFHGENLQAFEIGFSYEQGLGVRSLFDQLKLSQIEDMDQSLKKVQQGKSHIDFCFG